MTLANIKTDAQQDATLDLVRAIRRAHHSRYSPHDENNRAAGVVMFTVRDIHEFARRPVEEGVTVSGTRRCE